MSRLHANVRPALCICSATIASAAVPEIDRFTPRGGQRGTEVEVIFSGQRLGDARGLLFYEPGIAVKSLEVLPDKRVKTRLALAGDCPLGPHALRLQSATGISNLVTFSVGGAGGSQRNQAQQRLCQAAEDRSEFDGQRRGPERGRQLLCRRGEEGPAAERRGGGPAAGRIVLRSRRWRSWTPTASCWPRPTTRRSCARTAPAR